jgi:hypothetical protein
MNRMAEAIHRGFHHALAQRRVRVDGEHDVLEAHRSGASFSSGVDTALNINLVARDQKDRTAAVTSDTFVVAYGLSILPRASTSKLSDGGSAACCSASASSASCDGAAVRRSPVSQG